ncbi:hypothetical protein CXG81DRAFT_27024 [Caulochytrium protostelioides]|uniref:Uncharacterized protein n=1 Tax=Caulochytrium protostelioides TaxID=1555241 RepID=A0A4P9X575_9FUNG|nr:hypothetical protein CXG81DRAFT_27024 [Caulochytrium protostelioides]|eukprot:RKP00266.1 hypothetical protein CXG81DRAFT_27024 [Caulochytrium protostelioides]
MLSTTLPVYLRDHVRALSPSPGCAYGRPGATSPSPTSGAASPTTMVGVMAPTAQAQLHRSHHQRSPPLANHLPAALPSSPTPSLTARTRSSSSRLAVDAQAAVSQDQARAAAAVARPVAQHAQHSPYGNALAAELPTPAWWDPASSPGSPLSAASPSLASAATSPSLLAMDSLLLSSPRFGSRSPTTAMGCGHDPWNGMLAPSLVRELTLSPDACRAGSPLGMARVSPGLSSATLTSFSGHGRMAL